MTEKGRKFLFDIQIAIGLIEEFIAGTNEFTLYEKDRKTQSAVERQLVIIGEALNKIRQTETGLTIENAAQIIAFRNRLVHTYDSIDHAIVWVILKRHLPALKGEIDKLIN